MQKRTIFLLQGTKEQNQELMKIFGETQEFEVVGSAVDGISAIPAIEEKKPKILITDLVLSGYDGLSVISKVRELKLAIKIVVLRLN